MVIPKFFSNYHLVRSKVEENNPSRFQKRVMTAFNNWSLADVHISGKGAKTCQLSADGRPMHRSSGGFCTSPFGPSNFEKDALATRQNLELRIPPELEQYFDDLDIWMLQYLEQHSERIFKRVLSSDQLRDAYHPTLKRNGDYPALLRMKIDSEGRRACRFWTAEQQKRGAPDDWRDAELKVMFHVSHLWIMGTSCGLVLNTTDILVQEGSTAFPFPVEQSPAW
jgi:hypothetical protein